MDYEPLLEEQIDAGARFIQEFEKYAPIRAAFWLKSPHRRWWDLYVTSDQITDENYVQSYREVGRVIRQLQDPEVNSTRVRMLTADKMLAQAAVELRESRPLSRPIRVRDTVLGTTEAEEVYVYPIPIVAPVQKASSWTGDDGSREQRQ